jgi:hypothetical protein
MGVDGMIVSYRFTLFSIIISRMLDVLTTQLALNIGAFETNPFARFIFNIIGVNNVIYILPFHVIIVIIGVNFIYYIINHVTFSNNINFYLKLWNFMIIVLILSNIACPINNLLVIGGII